ncbi:MAG: stage sporulation protein [Clostridia bacterium]|nr:stage sporulation protein [Clostridia bacterium]
MRRRWRIIFYLLLIFINFTPQVMARELSGEGSRPVFLLDEEIRRQLGELDLGGVEDFLQHLDREVGQYLPRLDLRQTVLALARGEFSLSPAGILQGLLRYFFHEVWANLALLGQLIVLAVVCALLTNLQAAFEKGTVGQLARGVAFLALSAIALTSFHVALRSGSEAIERMVSFLQAMVPLQAVLLAAVGSFSSAAILQPVLLVAVSVLSTVTRTTIFPVLYFAAVLGVVSQLSDRFQVSKLADLLRQATVALLGLMLTVFIGVLTVYGVAGSVADGVGLRAAEFATAVFIPAIGKILSDAVGVVAGTTLLIKNGVGLVGAMGILALTALPALKILALVAVYKIAAALVQPFGESGTVEVLNGMGNALVLIFACVTSVGLMFFMAIALLVALGNLTLALR